MRTMPKIKHRYIRIPVNQETAGYLQAQNFEGLSNQDFQKILKTASLKPDQTAEFIIPRKYDTQFFYETYDLNTPVGLILGLIATSMYSHWISTAFIDICRMWEQGKVEDLQISFTPATSTMEAQITHPDETTSPVQSLAALRQELEKYLR